MPRQKKPSVGARTRRTRVLKDPYDSMTREEAEQQLDQVVKRVGGKRTMVGSSVEAIELPGGDLGTLFDVLRLACRALPDD
jgi:hypothetical protein